MKDPTKMSAQEKHDYIESQFSWIDSLLGDVRTFLDGIENFIQHEGEFCDDLTRGGGNMSIPIVVYTALELLSALHAGKTSYKDNAAYNATENVKAFVVRYFPDNYKSYPLLLWDGIRNGIVHTFSPKPFRYKRYWIGFRFFVEDPNEPACVIKDNDTIRININAFELHKVLKKTIQDYRAELKNDQSLQDNFILAWSSIEEYTRNIDPGSEKGKEVAHLLSELTKSNNCLVLQPQLQ